MLVGSEDRLYSGALGQACDHVVQRGQCRQSGT